MHIITLGDLINNTQFDINAHCEVYPTTDEGRMSPLHDSDIEMHFDDAVKCITVRDNVIVVEI